MNQTNAAKAPVSSNGALNRDDVTPAVDGIQRTINREMVVCALRDLWIWPDMVAFDRWVRNPQAHGGGRRDAILMELLLGDFYSRKAFTQEESRAIAAARLAVVETISEKAQTILA
jgi:hypothetical protein